VAGVYVGSHVLRDRHVIRNFWLIPFRDFFGFAVWLTGVFGNRVVWRGQQLRLLPDGRISEVK
jgi:ceramide glucosyltransferase